MQAREERSVNSDSNSNNFVKGILDAARSKEAMAYIEQKLKEQGQSLLRLLSRVDDNHVINSMLTNSFLSAPLRQAVIGVFASAYRTLDPVVVRGNQLRPIPSNEANQFMERAIFLLNNNLTSGANIANQLQSKNRSLFEYCLKLSDPKIIAAMFKCSHVGKMLHPTERQILISQFNEVYNNIQSPRPSPAAKPQLTPKQANDLLAAMFAEPLLEKAIDKVQEKLLHHNLFDICSKANDPALIRKIFLRENQAFWSRLSPQQRYSVFQTHRDIYEKLVHDYNRQQSSAPNQQDISTPPFNMGEETDPYAILGLDGDELSSMNANEAEEKIKSAYKKMALKHHPDRNLGDEEGANARMKLVTGAKDFLVKPENRETWKNWKNAQQSESPRPGPRM
ncbi:J domain-containing protein [Legionella cardiaca]|uniref:J domain-containing protein n=1 Tax=Legionella cardiaca TaxID=1071983 RepID=A0ABY8ASE9_9GAMM|nr:J domain-containing protein [Legionella cardiaca]WED42699.1 J domain-containing protein [Legionella cardiaca]